jgi:hypothetical protein
MKIFTIFLQDPTQEKSSGRPLVFNKYELVSHIQYPWIQMVKASPYHMREGLRIGSHTPKIDPKEI